MSSATMQNTYVAQSPSSLRDLWPQLATAGANAKITLTLELYKSADITNPESPEEGWNPPVIEVLYGEWAAALRDAPLANGVSPDAISSGGGPTWRIVFDITRPSIRNPSRPAFVPYEAQGLARVTNILRSIFKDRGSALEATIVGAPCWCLLQEDERNVLLPKARSWPVSRASHVNLAADKGGTCLRLASEHWDDEHWGIE